MKSEENKLHIFDDMVMDAQKYLFDVPYPKLTKEYEERYGYNQHMSLWYTAPIVMIVGESSDNIYVNHFVENISELQQRHSYRHACWTDTNKMYLYDNQLWYCWNITDLANDEKLFRILAEINIAMIAKNDKLMDELVASVYDGLYEFLHMYEERRNGSRGCPAQLVINNIEMRFLKYVDASRTKLWYL